MNTTRTVKATKEVAKELGFKPAALLQHIQQGNIAPPAERIGGAYLWRPAEVRAAREILANPARRRRGRPRKVETASKA